MNNTQTKKGRKPKEKRYDSKFAEVLRALLAKKEESGITLSAVADDLGITRQSLAQYRDGNNIPDIVILGRMADYFNATTDYLLGRTVIRSANPDIKMLHDLTGLSEESIDYLCQNKNKLEKTTLDALLSEMGFRLLGIGYDFVDMYKIYAFRKAALRQFSADNNLPITDQMLFEKEEYALKEVVGEEQYLRMKLELNNYCKEQAKLLGIDEPSCDVKYKEFLLQEETKNLISDAFVAFCDTPISEFYDNYYSKLFDLKGNNEATLELDLEEIQFMKSIIDNKGGD